MCPVNLSTHSQCEGIQTQFYGTALGRCPQPASVTVRNASIYTCRGIVLVVTAGHNPATFRLSVELSSN